MCQIAILGNIGVKFDPYKQKKSDTQACHSECLHNGIILIVYILQICWCKGSAFFWNIKIISCKFAYFLFFLYFCSRIVHWHLDKTTWEGAYILPLMLCIAYKSIFEILIKQLDYQATSSSRVVYVLQIVHWNPDKTTLRSPPQAVRRLCISFKLFIEILIKQLLIASMLICLSCVYPSNCSLKSW